MNKKITVNDIKKESCGHPLKHLQAPCSCCVTGFRGVIHLLSEPTQQHLAEHLEWDNGIEHPWDEGMIKIPVPQLIINEKLLHAIHSQPKVKDET